MQDGDGDAVTQKKDCVPTTSSSLSSPAHDKAKAELADFMQANPEVVLQALQEFQKQHSITSILPLAPYPKTKHAYIRGATALTQKEMREALHKKEMEREQNKQAKAERKRMREEQHKKAQVKQKKKKVEEVMTDEDDEQEEEQEEEEEDADDQEENKKKQGKVDAAATGTTASSSSSFFAGDKLRRSTRKSTIKRTDSQANAQMMESMEQEENADADSSCSSLSASSAASTPTREQKESEGRWQCQVCHKLERSADADDDDADDDDEEESIGWIECGHCHKHFHIECLGLTRAQFNRVKNSPWTCPLCTK